MDVISYKPLWLSLCVALAGCQSGTVQPPAEQTAATLSMTSAAPLEAESAQLIGNDGFWPGASQLLVRAGCALVGKLDELAEGSKR